MFRAARSKFLSIVNFLIEDGDDMSDRIDGYEEVWRKHLDKIQSLIDHGITDLSRILNIIQKDDMLMSDMEDLISNSLNFPRDKRNIPLFKLIVSNRKYVSVPRGYTCNMAVANVVSRIAEDTDVLVELGSGWGRNLFLTYLQNPFDHVRYVACEPTESGRQATEILGSLDNDICVTAHYFDFDEPDLSFLTGKPNVLFFTNHSIEQCVHFDCRVFDMMMETSSKCTCVHMEPVGWQNDPQAGMVKRIIEKDRIPAVSSFKMTFSDKHLAENAMVWASKFKYNTDLLNTIDHYQKSGIIDVDTFYLDFFGDNPLNPSTLIVWHKNGS